MIVDDGAQVGATRGGGIAVCREVRPRGKVRHPQLVDGRGLEGLRGTGDSLMELSAPGASVQVVGSEATVDRADGRQCGILRAPQAVEDFHSDARLGADSREDPLLLLRSECAGKAAIGAGLGMERREAAVTEGIPPVLEGAQGDNELQAIGALDGDAGDHLQGRAERQALVDEVLDFGNQGETLQGQGLSVVGRAFFVHRPQFETP